MPALPVHAVAASDGERCSTWAQTMNVDPIGTAGSFGGVVLVELPTPWPADVSVDPRLGGAAADLQAAGLRLQLVRDDTTRSGRRRRVISYRHEPTTWFRGFAHHELLVDEPDLPATLRAIGRGETRHTLDGPEVDLLVCTHGTRDVCCGASGTRLATELTGLLNGIDPTDSAGRADAGNGAGIRVWKTSHLGGHRFAPTAMLLPHGTVWGYLDVPVISDVIDQQVEVDRVLGSYRGSVAMSTPELQVLERVAFRETGWSWLSHRRRGVDVGSGSWAVESVDQHGNQTRWDGVVMTGRELPVPACRQPAERWTKQERELTVAAYRRSTAAACVVLDADGP